MEKDKSRFIIWLLVVIIILLVTVIGVLLVKTVNENGTEIMGNTNNQENVNNEVADNVENTVGNNDTTNTKEENNKSEVKTEIKEVEKYVFAKFDNSKVKDDIRLTETLIRLGAPLDSALISVNGTVNVRIVKDNQSKNVPITNLSGKVVDAIGGPLGDGANAIMYLLMEDGTVEYTEELWTATTSNYKTLEDITEIKSVGKVEGLSNIVRICYLNNNKAGVPIAIDKDGYSHSLSGVKVQRRGLDF